MAITKKPETKVPREVFALGWVSLLNDSASEMIHPLLPIFLTQVLRASTVALGIIEGIAETTASLLKLVSGILSDRIRRRKPLVVVGYTLAVLSRPLIGLTQSWGQVLGLRFFDRIGKGVRTAPRDALIADVTPPEIRGKAFGVHRSLDHLGAIVGPILAIVVMAIFGTRLRWVFLLALIPGALAVLILLTFVHEPERKTLLTSSKESLSLTGWKELSRNYKTFLFIVFLFTLGNATDAFLILRAQTSGIPVGWIPALWMLFNGSKMLLSVPAGIISDRYGRRITIVLGWLIYGTAYLGFAVATTAWAVILLFVYYGLFYAFTEGVERAFVADLVSAERQGTAYGWYHLMIGLGSLPASLLFGWIWKAVSPSAAFLVGAGLALLAMVLLLTLVKEVPSHPASTSG